MRESLTTFLLTAFLSAPALAWGPEGHRIVADIAKDHLNAKARHAIVLLLGNDDLAFISTWADDIKSERPETFGWHFVDIPWTAEGFSEQRDCYHPEPRDPGTLTDHHNCVVDRISMFQAVLQNPHAPRAERVEALKFLVHFVGDIHQPLHAIAQGRGGNDVHVVEFGSLKCGTRPCNLHGTWDIGLIEHAHLPEYAYVRHLEESVVPKLTAARGSDPAQWADESFRIAHGVWLNDGSAIDESYYRRNIHIVDDQLARAGLRLAALLNEALGK